MCGRYYIDTLPEQIAAEFDLHQTPELIPRYNVAPTDMMPIVIAAPGERRCGPARWGLIPFWAKDHKIGYRTINARCETLTSKPAFREAVKRRRCLVPASGFYEWEKRDDGRQPFVIRPAEGRLIAFAGLWERWKSPDDETIISFTIVTTQPQSKVASLHDRMPVIVHPDRYQHWLAAPVDELAEHYTPWCEDALEIYPVGREVNSVRNDSPGLIERRE